MYSDCFQELTLRSQSFIAIFLSVEIERRLDSRVTEDSLHRLRFDFRFVHQPVAKRVTKVDIRVEPRSGRTLPKHKFLRNKCVVSVTSSKDEFTRVPG
jgi:hypothetical protein